MTGKTGTKGHRAEEALRSYFLSTGYFVARSVPFFYKGFDVTDVDLWLYMRSSTVSRERLIVDVKQRKTPQALERVFWCKGLQNVLGVDRCLVATTDNRKETREFGEEHGITVLHGDFLHRIVTGFTGYSERITEEAFVTQIAGPCLVDASIVWHKLYLTSKGDLLTTLGFGGCNRFLRSIRFLLEEYLASDKASVSALRLLYAIISYFLLSVDYLSRLIAHLDTSSRQEALAEGFRFGDAGKQRSEEILNIALQLVGETPTKDLFSRPRMEEEIRKQLGNYPAEMLAEFFARPESLKQTFQWAREFDQLAFGVNVVRPDACTPALKGLVALLCDFFSIDRRKVV